MQKSETLHLFNFHQQIEKKKYVGNDGIHIVWNENDRDYRPGTIRGDFNFVHVIIHPLRNGLYKIKIEKKKNAKEKIFYGKAVNSFGPLLSGMVLPMSILPILVRYTIINGRKSIKKVGLGNPLTQRRETIEKIINNYRIKPTDRSDESAIVNKFINSATR